MKYTRLLRIILEKYKQDLSPEEYTSFENYVHSMMNAIINDLAHLGPGAERGKKIQELVDNESDQNYSAKVTCHKGCSSCCHLKVEITSDDAAVVLEGIAESQIKLDEVRLNELASRSRQDEKWNRGVVQDNRCLLLSDQGACGIYQYRPAACRKLIVTSDPQECSDTKGKILPVHMPKAEIIISAALNLEDNNLGIFATMIAEKLQNQSSKKAFEEVQNDVSNSLDL